MQSVQQDNRGKRIKFTDFPRSSSNNVKKQSMYVFKNCLVIYSKVIYNLFLVSKDYHR